MSKAASPHSDRVRAHRKQFIVGPEPLELIETWVRVDLGDGLYLSHCPDLETAGAVDGDGRSWTLLGLAAPMRPGDLDPLDALAEASSVDVHRCYAAWSGRWVLVGAGEVHMDGAGMRACYYGSDPDGRSWASSSPALLARRLRLDADAGVDPRTLRHERGVSWFPPPRSRREGVYRLLPSQILDLREGRPRPRPLTEPIEPDRPYAETCEEIAVSLTESVRRAPDPGEPLWVSLSSGGDSRLILAAARAAGRPVRLCTREGARSSLGDQIVPGRIANDLEYEIVYLSPNPVVETRRALVREHTGGQISDTDVLHFLTGIRDPLTGITIGGQCAGVLKGRYHVRRPVHYDSPRDVALGLAAAHGEPPGSSAVPALTEWAEWAWETRGTLSWPDRFYIEQHACGWQSAKEQLYDVDGHSRFFVLNSAYFFGLACSVDPSIRAERRLLGDLIRRLAPELLEYPINPPAWRLGPAVLSHLIRRARRRRAR
ncbi:MAG: hypothetical protein MJB57_01355 [Gemmatimonadetes bacterium]|nr:hypothetical protein [Gemmatimonadota bacterium]